MASSPPKPLKPAQKAAICAAAALVCLPLTQRSEGVVHTPQLDPAGILDVCYGDRYNIDPGKIYSTDECAVRLRKRLAADYAPRILDCLPELGDQRYIKVFGALLDAGYNAGAAAVCRSRMAASIHQGHWLQACSGFYGWRATALDRRTHQRIALKGLTIRRANEAKLCNQGVRNAQIVAVDAPRLEPGVSRAPVVVQPAPPVDQHPGFWARLRHFLGL